MKNSIQKYLHAPKWVFFLLLGVLVLRIPSLLEPYYYGDEMIYLALGDAAKKGITLYKGIHDNKPPLLYLTAALAGNLFWFRAILAIWHLATVFIFWKFVQHLYSKNIRLQKIATFVFALLTTIPLLEGNVANSEIFMIGPTMLAFLILLSKKPTYKVTITAGALLSIATLFKVPALFDIPAIIFYWIATTKLTFPNIAKITKRTLLLAAGYLTPILVTFVWYYLQGALSEYFIAAFGQNVGYLSSFRPDEVKEPFLVKNGPLLTRAALVASALGLLYIVRKKVSKQFLFLTGWLVLTLFAVTLSERPYPHYLIQSIPALAVLIAMFFSLKTLEQSLVIIPITLFFIPPVVFNFWHYPSWPYYERFINFSLGSMSLDEYRNSFGSNVVVDYKISKYIISTTNEADSIFVWGDNGTIYALTHRLPPTRFVVDYHISDFSSPTETIQVLNDNKPKLIIIMTTGNTFPELKRFTQKNYSLIKIIDDTQIWQLLNPNIRKTLQ